MMDYCVRPRHIYWHSRTCNRSSLCTRPFNLVEFHVSYILDRASVHEISALVIWFHCISYIFIHYGDIDPLYIISYYGEIDMLYIFIHFGDSNLLYSVCGNDHRCHILYIMPIHSHCTLMYSGLLYVFVVICRHLLLYYTDGWFVLPPSSSSLHF